jgi:hypothetical protein
MGSGPIADTFRLHRPTPPGQGKSGHPAFCPGWSPDVAMRALLAEDVHFVPDVEPPHEQPVDDIRLGPKWHEPRGDAAAIQATGRRSAEQDRSSADRRGPDRVDNDRGQGHLWRRDRRDRSRRRVGAAASPARHGSKAASGGPEPHQASGEDRKQAEPNDRADARHRKGRDRARQRAEVEGSCPGTGTWLVPGSGR